MALNSLPDHDLPDSMYTQCPQCKTIFRLRVEQLRCGQGETRCHRCKINFNALAAINPTPENISFFSFDAYRIPTLEPNQAVENLHKGGPVSDRRRKKRQPQKDNHTDTDSKHPDTENTTTPWDRASWLLPEHALFWRYGVMGLSLLFCSQIILFNSHELTHSTWLRPLLKTINPWLAPYRNTVELSVLDSKLEPLTTNGQQLQLHILVRNTAAFPQARPNIKLTLLKNNNIPFANHVFYPADYRLPGIANNDAIPPAVITEILLPFVHPGQDPFGYKFTFL